MRDVSAHPDVPADDFYRLTIKLVSLDYLPMLEALSREVDAPTYEDGDSASQTYHWHAEPRDYGLLDPFVDHLARGGVPLSAAWVRHLDAEGYPVVSVDYDWNGCGCTPCREGGLDLLLHTGHGASVNFD